MDAPIFRSCFFPLAGFAMAMAALEKEPNLSHFFAAGAAHFASGTGIGARLAKEGYTVTRIEE